jgi:hypothetical protein
VLENIAHGGVLLRPHLDLFEAKTHAFLDGV